MYHNILISFIATELFRQSEICECVHGCQGMNKELFKLVSQTESDVLIDQPRVVDPSPFSLFLNASHWHFVIVNCKLELSSINTE